MRFGVHLGAVRPSLWPEVAEAADGLGYESVWLPEHLVVPMDAAGSPHDGSEHPPIPSDVPIFDPFGMLCFLAARTSRIRLGTHVYNIGLRHPFVTARAAATVDVLSGGRLLLGIGASWLRAEWEAVGLGADFDRRGARVDEAIDVCRRLWTEPVVAHDGEHFSFGATAFEPKPVGGADGGVPLHIGGDGAAALRRAATVGAGWMPMNHTVGELRASVDKLHELAPGRSIEVTVSAAAPTPEEIDAWAAAGVTRLIVRPWRRSDEAIDGLARFATEVGS